MAFLLIKSFLMKKEFQNRRRQENNEDENKLRSRFKTADNVLCRVCEGAGKVNVFSAHRGRNLAEDMRQCSGVPVYMNDGLPHWLCGACLELLQSAVKFRRMCRDTAEKLLQLTTTNKGESVKSSRPEYKNTKRTTQKRLKLKTGTKENAEIRVKQVNLDTSEQPSTLTEDKETSLDNGDDAPISLQDHDGSDEMPARLLPEPRLDLKYCKYCRRGFDSLRKYHTHTRECYKLARERAATRPKNAKPQCDFVCEICGKVVCTLHTLKVHRLIHSNVYPFKCNLCSFRAKGRDALTSHRRIHAAEKPFVCDHCPRAFNNRSNRSKHMQRLHCSFTVECSICSKKLRHIHALKAHMKKHHSGQRVALCHICGKQYKERKYLYKHRIKQHDYRASRTERWAAYQQGDSIEAEIIQSEYEKQQESAVLQT